jgi:hypothetical protein
MIHTEVWSVLFPVMDYTEDMPLLGMHQVTLESELMYLQVQKGCVLLPLMERVTSVCAMYSYELGWAKASSMHLKVLQHILHIIHFLIHPVVWHISESKRKYSQKTNAAFKCSQTTEINYNYDTSSQNTTIHYIQL